MHQPQEDIETLRRRFYTTLIAFLSGGTYDNIPLSLADRFIKSFQKSGESADRLTRALNRITIFGTVIAGIGVLIAAGSLGLDMYKTFFQSQ